MIKTPEKIAAGGNVNCNEKNGVIGAVIKYNGKNCILTVSHLIRIGNCSLGDTVKVNGFKGIIIEILLDYDLAIVEIKAPSPILEFSKIGKPEIGPAHALHGGFRNPCNIMTVGRIFHYLSFPFSSIPLPGDSGSPIIQNGKVVGILSSVFYNNATGIAISLESFKNL